MGSHEFSAAIMPPIAKSCAPQLVRHTRFPWAVSWQRSLPFPEQSPETFMAEGEGETLRWFATSGKAKIHAYFGSRAAWEAIPRDWDVFLPCASLSPAPILFDHGYDESRLPQDRTEERGP